MIASTMGAGLPWKLARALIAEKFGYKLHELDAADCDDVIQAWLLINLYESESTKRAMNKPSGMD